jgi:hypothetical protein
MLVLLSQEVCTQKESTHCSLNVVNGWMILTIKPTFCINHALAYAQIYIGHLYEPTDGLKSYNGRLSAMPNVGV